MVRAKLKKAVALLLCILTAIPLCGCWDYHEIETYSIVSGLAIDKGQNGYKYHLTFECLNTGGGDNLNKSLTLETDGNTIFDAVRASLKKSDKKLYFSNCKLVILSKDLASEGIAPLIDWFIRDAELRTTLVFLVSKEQTAGEILRLKSKSGESLSFQIINMLDEATKFEGREQSLRLYEINNILNTKGRELTLSGIRIKDDDSGPSLQLTASAVFKGDKLVGWLNEDQCEYYMFIKNKICGGLIITGLTPNKKDIALEIFKNNTKITPVIKGKKITMKIDVNTTVAYAEDNSSYDYLEHYGIPTIEKCANTTVKNGITGVIAHVKEQYGSDIFGFGKIIYDKYPDVWEKIEKSGVNPFDKLDFEVNTDVKIKNTAVALPKGGE